ncbi:MAG: hypothetical protein ACM3N9_01915, partial [Syntrophothermus sp.]
YNFRMLVRARCDSAIMSGTSKELDNATVSWDSATKIFTFAYGHVMGADSIIRIGIVRVKCSNDIILPGSTAVILYNSYSEDDNILSGNDTITNVFEDAMGCHFRSVMVNGRMEKVNNGNVSFSAELEALVRPSRNIEFSGKMNGVSSLGYTFSSDIKTALVYESCPWPIEGLISVTVAAAPVNTSSIDFIHSDSCNYLMNYTIGGTVLKVKKLTRYLI